MRASKAAHSGLDALVPPFGKSFPTKIKSYKGGPASAQTSGMTRPSILGWFTDWMVTFCQLGRLKRTLTPPPPAPPPCPFLSPGATNHTCSVGLAVVPVIIVPPTLKTNGLELGKSTCALVSPTASPEPSSPDEMQTVIPSKATACRRALICLRADADQSGESSANPQLTESVTGLAGFPAISLFSISTHPFCVKGAK